MSVGPTVLGKRQTVCGESERVTVLEVQTVLGSLETHWGLYTAEEPFTRDQNFMYTRVGTVDKKKLRQRKGKGGRRGKT